MAVGMANTEMAGITSCTRWIYHRKWEKQQMASLVLRWWLLDRTDSSLTRACAVTTSLLPFSLLFLPLHSALYNCCAAQEQHWLDPTANPPISHNHACRPVAIIGCPKSFEEIAESILACREFVCMYVCTVVSPFP